MKIGVIGLWHLGTIAAAGLAELGHQVVGVDDGQKVVADLNKGEPPLDETGLKQSLAKNKIEFSTDYSALKECEAVFLCFDTPVSESDEPDISILFASVKKMSAHLRPNALFVVMSQVPVGTTRELARSAGLEKQAIYFPENLQLGKALECFLRPDRLVIGADSPEARQNFAEIIKELPGERLEMNIASAEMSKHALNAFLSTSLSFIFFISDLCEKVGADVNSVSRALKADKRIGPGAYLNTGPGFSGGTLGRDLRALEQIAGKVGVEASLVKSVIKTNLARRQYIVDRLRQALAKPLSGATIGILGVTYKPGTPTLRRSLAVEIIKLLKKDGAQIRAYDPLAASKDFQEETGLPLAGDAYALAAGCQALLLLTDWPEFAGLDFTRLRKIMSEPYLLFDTRNMLKNSQDKIGSAGLSYLGVGTGS